MKVKFDNVLKFITTPKTKSIHLLHLFYVHGCFPGTPALLHYGFTIWWLQTTEEDLETLEQES